MLDQIIRIIKFSTNDCDIWLLADHQHFFDPSRSNDFYIIIQEQQITALCILCCKIIDCGIIKSLFPGEHPCFWITPGKIFIILKCFWLFAVIFNYQYLVIFPC